MMDDVLLFGANQREHDKRLAAVFECLETANVTLNPNYRELLRIHGFGPTVLALYNPQANFNFKVSADASLEQFSFISPTT